MKVLSSPEKVSPPANGRSWKRLSALPDMEKILYYILLFSEFYS